MDEYTTFKYLALRPDLYSIYEYDLFEIQKYYYTLEIDKKISYDPLLYLSANLRTIMTSKNIKLYYKHLRTPSAILYKNKPLVVNNKITDEFKINIIKIGLENGNTQKCQFDSQSYYNMYHELIEEFCSYLDYTIECIQEKACIFYIAYGYHNNIHLKPVNALRFIASYTDLIEKYGCDIHEGAKEFYSNNMPVTFNPYVYIASNIKNHKYLEEFINCRGEIDDERVTKHYIRKGWKEKLPINTFNSWTYLANNFQRIGKILRKQIDTEYRKEYDVLRLSKELVAKDYIKKYKKAKLNKFNAIKFVKRYIDDDEYINKNKQLNIHNAEEYFVKYYVISERIRFETTMKFKLSNFLKDRTVDSIKQIPYNAIRYLIETKFI